MVGPFHPWPFATGVEVYFHGNIMVISWFINAELKQFYCSYSRTRIIQKDFLQFLIIFLRSALLLNRNKRNC